MTSTEGSTGGDRLERAIAAHHRFLRGEGPQRRDELLAANADVRDLLEVLLAEDEADGASIAGAAMAEVGDFHILGELGRGGMGVVYEAEQVSLGRKVALKMLRVDGLADPRALLRFHREAQLVASLDHPAITKVFAVGRDDDRYFFAMELVTGGSLAEMLHALQGTAPEAARAPDGRALGAFALDVGQQLAAALDHAHRAGIVHRDVKPGNVMLRADGSVMLTDFGIARGDDAVTLTRTGDFAGTPSYSSPEQLRGSAVDARADVFSLGATLYELLTLRRPFAAETTAETRVLIEKVDPKPPSRHNPAVSRDLDAIVLRALEKDPGRRYRSAAEMAQDLRNCAAGRPVTARRVGPGVRLSRWCRRNPIAAVLIATIAIGLAAVSYATREAMASSREAADRLVQFRCVKVERDIRVLRRAIVDAPGPLPENVARLAEVVGQLDQLLLQVPELRDVLATLRAQGRPLDAPDASRLTTPHPAEVRVAWLRRARDAIAFRLSELVEEGQATPAWQAQVSERLAAIEAERSALLQEIGARRRFAFADREDEYLHDAIEDNLAGLVWIEKHN
ncbi:MAG: serine/threonine protein kinase, partial [Planctomycetes bacterium]|nr:serine/threonine protein kinase [Planctomycetota bacterium]